MTTATRTRKPATKKARSANVQPLDNGGQVIWLTINGQALAYRLTPLASDFGVAFRVRKCVYAEGKGGEEYDVLLHGKESSCTCPGHTYRSKCKHVDALTALVQSGKLAVHEAAPTPEAEEEETVEITEAPPQPRKPWCEHCNDDPAVYCSHCSL
jgi:hypothetical protein